MHAAILGQHISQWGLANRPFVIFWFRPGSQVDQTKSDKPTGAVLFILVERVNHPRLYLSKSWALLMATRIR